METTIKAPRRKKGEDAAYLYDCVGQLNFKAADNNALDKLKLGILAKAMTPVNAKARDKEFDKWMEKRILAFLKKHKLTITKTDG